MHHIYAHRDTCLASEHHLNLVCFSELCCLSQRFRHSAVLEYFQIGSLQDYLIVICLLLLLRLIAFIFSGQRINFSARKGKQLKKENYS